MQRLYLKLLAMNIKDEFAILLVRWQVQRVLTWLFRAVVVLATQAIHTRKRYFDSENRTLLGDHLEHVLARDDLKHEPGILNDDALDAHPTRTRAAHDLDLGTVEIRTGQLGGGVDAPAAQIPGPQDLPDVIEPQRVQGRKRLVPPRLALDRRPVQPQPPPLPGRQWLRPELLGAVLDLLLAGGAAGLAGGGGGRWGVCAQAQRAVLDLFRVDAVDRGWGVATGEEVARHCFGVG
ncbi:hypothetical protein PspLS_05152 [Pyricularia sp. CBS 133598]|nr:hypothetical protein PspLS_05152 [Pyricularia sp. CBS 133598]